MRYNTTALLMSLLLVFSAAQAQTTVVSDTFTLTAERTDHLNLTGQTTEIGNRQWLGESSTSGYYYFLTADGKVNRYRDGSGTTQGLRFMGVPYLVNPAGEVVTISADITWGESPLATSNASGVGFLPDGVVFEGGLTFWEETSLGVFMYETGRWKVFIQDIAQAYVTLIDTDDPLGDYDAVAPITSPGSGPVTKNLKLSYDTVNNTFSVWFDAAQLVNNLDLSDKNPVISTPWAPDIAFGIFALPGRGDMPDNRVDNFLIESTNPLLDPPTIAQVKALKVKDANPQELDWIAVGDQIYIKGMDMMPGASYDIDPDYDLFLNATDPNGPRYILLGVDESMSAPTTQYDAEFLTADGLLSTGCTLDYETETHLGAIGQFVLPMPQTTHDGPDLVVIMLDRQGDWGCSALKAQVQLLDASMNPIPGQVVQVACGSPEWTFTPADGGGTQHYDVTGVDPAWSAVIRDGSIVTRTNYVAFAVDILTGIEIGGIRLTNPADAHTTPVEIFTIPETGSYAWSDNSCEAGVYDATDINKDCVTDLEDFAMLAGQWLNCNTVFNPDCWN